MKSCIRTALLSETAAHSQALTLMSKSILLASTRTGMLGQNWRSSSYHLQGMLSPCLLGASTGWGEIADARPAHWHFRWVSAGWQMLMLIAGLRCWARSQRQQ